MMQERADLDHKYIGTCFDRQVRIDMWNQDKLKNQTVLLLGVGGLGSAILINLLRLGVKKIFIVDYDVVDIHNLNRQLMYSIEDVGNRKIASALKNLKHHNIANTQVVGFDGDAVKQWQQIIQFARESNVVFNCIDYGDKYDLAVASMCMALNVPLIMGGTFATMLTIDYVHAEGRACFLCLGDQAKNNGELVEKVSPKNVLGLDSLAFLPKNNNPIGRSSMVVCLMCAELMVSHYLNFLFLSEDRPYKTSRLVAYHNTFEIIKFQAEVDKKCPYCGDPNYVQPEKEENIMVESQKQLDAPAKEESPLKKENAQAEVDPVVSKAETEVQVSKEQSQAQESTETKQII